MFFSWNATVKRQRYDVEAKEIGIKRVYLIANDY